MSGVQPGLQCRRGDLDARFVLLPILDTLLDGGLVFFRPLAVLNFMDLDVVLVGAVKILLQVFDSVLPFLAFHLRRRDLDEVSRVHDVFVDTRDGAPVEFGATEDFLQIPVNAAPHDTLALGFEVANELPDRKSVV